MRRGWLIIVAALVVAGCSSRPEIPVNAQQTLVMESSLLAAGITADKPDIDKGGTQNVASTGLYNESNIPVTVNYRFFWYDAHGLEMHPLERPRTVTIPAGKSLDVNSIAPTLVASKVRLYLYL